MISKVQHICRFWWNSPPARTPDTGSQAYTKWNFYSIRKYYLQRYDWWSSFKTPESSWPSARPAPLAPDTQNLQCSPSIPCLISNAGRPAACTRRSFSHCQDRIFRRSSCIFLSKGYRSSILPRFRVLLQDRPYFFGLRTHPKDRLPWGCDQLYSRVSV